MAGSRKPSSNPVAVSPATLGGYFGEGSLWNVRSCRAEWLLTHQDEPSSQPRCWHGWYECCRSSPGLRPLGCCEDPRAAEASGDPAGEGLGPDGLRRGKEARAVGPGARVAMGTGGGRQPLPSGGGAGGRTVRRLGEGPEGARGAGAAGRHPQLFLLLRTSRPPGSCCLFGDSGSAE